MQSASLRAQGGRFYGRCPAAPLPTRSGESNAQRVSWPSKPLLAINNQHSHIDDELVRMQAQLLVQQQPYETSHMETRKHAVKHHVFHDTELHPYQRKPHRHVHHDELHEGQGAFDGVVAGNHRELERAVELSYQYSSNIVNYDTNKTPLQRNFVYRARVLDYSHPSTLARDILVSLLSSGKLVLELPDEPVAVSSLLTALGRAAAKLRTVGLATALDPVYDPAAVMSGSACSSSGGAAAHSGHHHYQSHHSGGVAGSGGGGSSPSASQDAVGTAAGARRSVHDSCCGAFVLCARAVPMPPAADPCATYTVGTSMGQEVLRVGPSVGVHALLPALLRAILRDGLCSLRCCWFDEDLAADSWSDDDDNADRGRAAAASAAAAAGGDGCEDPDGGCDASVLWSSTGQSGSPGSAPVSAPTAAPAGSLVRVPCVLRAIFKLDRQLRGLDLGGVVVLPHSFTRSRKNCNTQVLYLDVVIA